MKGSGSVPVGSGWRSGWTFSRGNVFRRRVELKVGFLGDEETGFFKEWKGGLLTVGSIVACRVVAGSFPILPYGCGRRSPASGHRPTPTVFDFSLDAKSQPPLGVLSDENPRIVRNKTEDEFHLAFPLPDFPVRMSTGSTILQFSRRNLHPAARTPHGPIATDACMQFSVVSMAG